MKRLRAPMSIFAATIVGFSAILFPQSARAACGSPPAMPALTFTTPKIVDPVRAGGEPDVLALHDGTLILASHPGTTHLYKTNLPDPNFVTPYDDSEYVWRSDDQGETWRYVGANGGDVGPHGGPGFSDPTLAEDLGGNVYISGTDYPTNIYVARSGDSGKNWTSNPVAGFLTDREWLAADQANTVYLLATDPSGARVILTSHDGGASFDWGFGMPVSGVDSPITVDQTDGRLYFPDGQQGSQQDGQPVTVQVFPNLRKGDTSSFKSFVWEGLPDVHGFINSSAVDAAGNVYITSNTDQQIRVSTSTDRGMSWTTTTIYQSHDTGVLWPWVSAGADGKVAVSWLASDQPSAGQAQGNFRVYAAESVTAHGWTDSCGAQRDPVWKTSVATPQPMHSGEICESGLNCNAGIGPSSDRRLGDYITNSITPDGKFVIAYADTAAQPRAAISHPAFVRETGGANFR